MTTEQINKIVSSYEKPIVTESKTERLKKLDKKVRRPAQIFALIYGIIGALVLGTGMSFALGVIGNSMAIGIVIGAIGIALVSTTYAIYNAIVDRRKNKHGGEIVKLANEILEEAKI